MYGWVWRKLPGGWVWKSLESLVLIVAISGVLVVVVFPWIEPKLPFSGNTVSGDTGGGSSVTPTPKPTGPSTTSVPNPSDTGDVLPGD